MRRRRRRCRDAKGVEQVGDWEGVSPPQPTKRSGERHELPNQVRGGATATNAFSARFGRHRKENAILLL